MKDIKWYIYSMYEGFWNNDDGWCENFKSATIFSNEEKQTFNLPIGRDVNWWIIGSLTTYAGHEGQLYDGQGDYIR